MFRRKHNHFLHLFVFIYTVLNSIRWTWAEANRRPTGGTRPRAAARGALRVPIKQLTFSETRRTYDGARGLNLIQPRNVT